MLACNFQRKPTPVRYPPRPISPATARSRSPALSAPGSPRRWPPRGANGRPETQYGEEGKSEQDIARRLAVVATESEVGEGFWLEPGAPTFRLDPGVDRATAETVMLLMTFAQNSGDEVTPVIEWSGANVEPTQPLMMPQHQPPGARYQKYQLRPALARPSLPKDEVTFDIRFRWRGATRQYRWSWPLYMRGKGIWGINNVAENTLEPKERTTLE